MRVFLVVVVCSCLLVASCSGMAKKKGKKKGRRANLEAERQRCAGLQPPQCPNKQQMAAQQTLVSPACLKCIGRCYNEGYPCVKRIQARRCGCPPPVVGIVKTCRACMEMKEPENSEM